MKRIYLLIITHLFIFCASAQDIYKITYNYFNNDVISKQDPIIVIADRNKSIVTKQSIVYGHGKYPFEESFLDNPSKSIIRQASFATNNKVKMIDNKAWTSYTLEPKIDSKVILGYDAKKAVTSINSNAIDIWYTTALPIHAAPNDIGLDLGLVLEYRRNGSSGIVATKIEKLNAWPTGITFPDTHAYVDKLTYSDLLWKSKFVQIPIFQDAQICFQPGIQSDSILRFAEGTVIVKKVKIPEVPANSQAFIELVEKSNGDAYDRTGSIFLIAEDQKISFFDGMKNGMNTLPAYDVGDGKSYLGMVRTENYSPIYELMRFFTPFGVSHFNNRLELKGKTWQDSSIYRQDVSEFLNVMSGQEVYIGVYIGNYDKGGHKVSLELTIHSGNSNYAHKVKTMPLFNTTNVMEMGGQTYPTLFASDQGLDFEFELKEDIKNAKLRYITTGHGGWGNGDEFVPKVNTIFIDNVMKHRFTPWRVDCGSYRLYNPVSGNFANGLSSSDLSRSNWCPGTITYPNYIDLGDLKAGKHSIKVHIPQGAPEGDSFSFWNVSGALIYDTND
ncbi:PNGase F N-terminal domain-containing protein [Sphingobacterium rhinopitheci]|uniref:PNGase F N-terminal domain-containing protein n=1 Tax=Sphingobacterium rhinopitheci TaxID=2781960 RepID=UPI001F52390C|nr:PNGase F N-terminal domain-containing protein [Sphingobacterium rhinopitheci]MCI0921272.1 peptide-N-glycosidase [Sphingobacterium rhinopitheci]